MIILTGSKFSNAFGQYNNRCEIGKVGDAQFKPHLKFLGHNDRYSFTLGLNVTGNFSPMLQGDGWLFTGNTNYEFRWKPTSPKLGFNDRGGMDWVIVLKKKPAINYLNFDYDHTLLDAFHQPALTAQEIAEGAVRPDYVVNSIAFYMSDRNGMNRGQPEADEFRCGKLGHLYRMRLQDALGNLSWADWSLEGTSQIRLSADPAWLNVATYPVTIMPVGDTFGYTTAGGSYTSLGISNALGALFTSPTNVSTIDSLTFYGSRNAASGTANVKGLRVLHSSLNIDTNGVGNPVAASTTPSWWTSNFGTPGGASSTDYILGIITDAGTRFYCDAGDTNQGHLDTTNDYTTPQNLGGIAHNNNKYSIYATYTPSDGAFIPKVFFM